MRRLEHPHVGGHERCAVDDVETGLRELLERPAEWLTDLGGVRKRQDHEQQETSDCVARESRRRNSH